MSFKTKTIYELLSWKLIMLLKKSSHPDPKGDNKQSSCKLSLIF